MPSSLRFKLGDVFAAEEPIARWLVVLSIGLNDLVFANRNFMETEDEQEAERTQFFRMSCLHLREVTKFLAESYERWPQITEFVDGLRCRRGCPEAERAVALRQPRCAGALQAL